MKKVLSGSVLLIAAWGLATEAGAQATVYPGSAGTTIVDVGREVCGTTPANLEFVDGVYYSVASASEFAATVPAVHAGIPNPMGENTPAASAGPFGVTVINPTDNLLNVTQIEIDGGASQLFNGIAAVQPVTGWTSTSTRVLWSGSIDVPRHAALDFIVQPRPADNDYLSVPVTIRATTAIGVLTNALHVTSERSAGNTPDVSLPFVQSGNQVFSGNLANGGAVETGMLKTFIVRVKESESGNFQPVPTGSLLTIEVPPGWTSVTTLASAGFGAATVTQPTGCTLGNISVATSVDILGATRDFSFTAVAPSGQGSVGIYQFPARLTNFGTTPAIDTRIEFAQVVTVPPTMGTREGLLTVSPWVATPKPMGHNRNSIWGLALANPTANPITVTEARLVAAGNQDLFRSPVGISPMSGWSSPNRWTVRWQGTEVIPPYSAADFMVQIQASGGNGVNNWPITATIFDSLGNSYVNTDGNTTEDGGEPSANLYYLVGGLPALYVFGVPSGQPRQFQVAVEELQGGFIPAGTTLRVVVPRGWSGVQATTQAGFSAPVITQPTGSVDGEVYVTLTSSLKDARRIFTFTAVAPPNLLESVFLFPTTLTGSGIDSICQALVQVIDNSGGLTVRHLSPSVTDTTVNQIDVLLVAQSDPSEDYLVEVHNFTTGAFETIASGPIALAPATLIGGTVTNNFVDYFDASTRIEARVSSNSLNNHRLDEDQLLFIVSYYRLLPTNVAPATTSANRTVAMEALRFEVDLGTVDLETIDVTALGSDVLNDIALVRLVADPNCNGIIEGGETDLASGTLGAGGTITFGSAGTALLSFAPAAPACAVLAFDIAPGATSGNIVSAQIFNGFDLTSNVGPYPFPCPSGYPVRSGDVLITSLDLDGDGLTDAEEGSPGIGTDPLDADSDDDGLLDGEELGGDAIFNLGVDTLPLDPDSDNDALWDGLEQGEPVLPGVTDGDLDGTPDVVDPAPGDPTIKGTDLVAFRPDLDPPTVTEALDDDSDDDGLLDGNEDLDQNGRLDGSVGGTGTAGSGETSPSSRDSDGDGIQDGTETGLVAPQGADTDLALFVPDADPGTMSYVLDLDSDDDGVADGIEDSNRDGARTAGELDNMDADGDDDGLADGAEVGPDGIQDPGETAALLTDSDNDLLQDGTEQGITAGIADPDGLGPALGTDPAVFRPDLHTGSMSNPLDDDTDDDGLLDGSEDFSLDGITTNMIGDTGTVGSGETHPLSPDSDGDGCQDGTELGLTAPQGTGTDLSFFQPDAVPAITSGPLDVDSDDDGLADGAEDADCDGAIDPGETDPSGDPSVLRNDEIAALSAWAAAKATIFAGGPLELAGPNLAPDQGEGPDPTLNGSTDDDDLYARRVTQPYVDPDALVPDQNRPLVFYQMTVGGNTLAVVRTGTSVTLSW